MDPVSKLDSDSGSVPVLSLRPSLSHVRENMSMTDVWQFLEEGATQKFGKGLT